MRKILIAGMACFLLFTSVLSAETVTVGGTALLETQYDPSDIKVVFERIAPSTLKDSTYTDTNGSYQLNIETGIYTVTYSKEGYFSHILYEQSYYSDATLDVIYLLETSSLLQVPDSFPSIQNAIDSSSDGDTVLVAPGTYYENINFNGKNITVASHFLTTRDTTFISQTVIDGNHNGHVVEFSSGEDSTTVLCGFIITNGYSFSDYSKGYTGGGILVIDSEPQLKYLKIIGNEASVGGGIELDRSDVLISNVKISDNRADIGGGIRCQYSSPEIINSIISKNDSRNGPLTFLQGKPLMSNVLITENTNDFYYGGGVLFFEYCEPTLTNVTVYNNTSPDNGSAVWCDDYSSVTIENSIIVGNHGESGIHNKAESINILFSAVFENGRQNFKNCGSFIGNNITANANGDSCDAFFNIQLDPMFVDPDNGDYHLLNISPCIGAGTSANAPKFDIEGNPRGTPPDIGAYEHALDAPAQAPSLTILTTSLPNAVDDAQYSATVSVDGDAEEFELLEGPEWLSVDNDGRLSGLPDDADVGTDVPISVRAASGDGLADTLTTAIDVINVEEPPEITDSDLPDAVAYQDYDHALAVSDPDLTDEFRFSILAGPEWLAINVSGVLSGMPADGDEAQDVTVSILVTDPTGLTDTITTTIDVTPGNSVFAEEVLPLEFAIESVHPNPFNPATTIGYSIPADDHVLLTVYNSNGQRIETLVDTFRQAGRHSVTWNAAGQSSGLYFCMLRANGRTVSRKMMYVK